jgi:tetratricopeptide (TPR) repeat protein
VPAEEFNVAAGANVAVTDFFSLHGGFQYRGSNPRISIGSTVDLKEVRIVMNYTLDLTTQIQLFDRMSVSAVLKLGDEGRYSLRERVDELYVAGLESYAQGDLDNAVRYWQAAIQLNPKFQPAIDNLVLAERAKELQKQMEKINKVE